MTARERRLEELLSAALTVLERVDRQTRGTEHDLRKIEPRIETLMTRTRCALQGRNE